MHAVGFKITWGVLRVQIMLGMKCREPINAYRGLYNASALLRMLVREKAEARASGTPVFFNLAQNFAFESLVEKTTTMEKKNHYHISD